jgi:hypothetical protein
MNSPTRAGVLTLATGLQIGGRFGVGQQNGYVALLGITGEEIYNLDPSDPRFVTEMVYGPLDGGTPAFGGNLFAQEYTNIRTANIMLHAMGNLSNTPPSGMSPVEKRATLGYAQTLIAYDLLRALVTRWDNGIPVDVDIDPTGPPAPIVDSGVAFAHIANLLDSAAANLDTAAMTSDVFPFQMSAGYAGFDKPSTFRRFTRALRARVAVYHNDFARALTLLRPDSTFIDDGSTFTTGVYHTFSSSPGDSTNNLFDPSARALVAHPSFATDVQFQDPPANTVPDQRFLNKTTPLAQSHSPSGGLDGSIPGVAAGWALNVYKSPTDPVPIIRNEELILLRAEANIGLGNLAAALADINNIRVNAGKLPAHAAFASQNEALTELLYNKRYSLFFEGGHRWIDLRHYGLLTDKPPGGTLTRESNPAGVRHFFNRFPFPTNECLARSPAPAQGCAQETGS